MSDPVRHNSRVCNFVSHLAEEGKARGSVWDGQGVSNPRLTGFQFQSVLTEPGTHQLLALPHDLFISMQDHDI